MVVRDLKDGSAILATQEDHAEVSAQFAAHWGNNHFTKLRPYESMVFATTYHDSGYREWEGRPPMNLAHGRPYGHREDPPSFEQVELEGYVRNIGWVRAHDPYAALIVSMHRTGLWQNRYQTIRSARSRTAERSPEIKAVIERLEGEQQREKKSLGRGDPIFEDELWFNYRLLQVYDILSLYFCSNGYEDDRLTKQVIAPVPVAYGTKEEVDLRIVPKNGHSVTITPYPFDCSPLRVSLRARIMAPGNFASEEECREAYYKAARSLLSFEITG